MTIEDLLVDELDAQFSKLRTEDLKPEEEKAVVDTLTKLMDRKIEMDRVHNESVDKAEARKSEELLKQQQLADEKKDRWIKNILSAAGIALPLLVTIWGTKVSLKFEEEGTVTTQMGRGFIQRLFPKK